MYTNGHELSVSHLSGVGLRVHDHLGSLTHLVQAPISPQKRYDDPDYEHGIPKVTFGSLPFVGSTQSLWNHPATQESCGFPFHAACWDILHAAAYPREIDVHTLKEFCMSCPGFNGVMDWEHDYGGIYEREPQWSPGYGGVIGDLKSPDTLFEIPEGQDLRRVMYRHDPINKPEIGKLLTLSEKSQREQRQINSESFAGAKGTYNADRSIDPFAALPPKIHDMILVLLPSKDVRNLKLASRVFASSSLSQKFWASRFQQGFEFSFIFEVRKDQESKSRPRDWKLLYDGIKRSVTGPNLQNRQRIWRLVLSLADSLTSIGSSCLKGDPAPTFHEPDFRQDNVHWRHAGSHIVEDTQWFRGGPRVLHSRTIHISERIMGIYVSFIEMGGRKVRDGDTVHTA